MNETSQLDELLDHWEDLRDQGRTLSVAELCADHPELSDVVSERIQTLISMDWLLDDEQVSDLSPRRGMPLEKSGSRHICSTFDRRLCSNRYH